MSFLVSRFCALSYLGANCCAMWVLFSVFSIVEGSAPDASVLLLWLLCLGTCSLGLPLFLRRERSERALIYFCAAFFGFQLVAALAFCRFWPGFTAFLICLAMWCYSYYTCFELGDKIPTAEKLNKSFELSCLILVFVLFFCSVKDVGLGIALPLGMFTLMCLFALVLIRSGEQPKLRGLLLGGGIVAVLAIISAAAAAMVSGGAAKLMAGFLAVLRYIGKAIDAFFMLILSLFPQKQYEQYLPMPEDGMAQLPVQDMSFELFDPKAVIIAALLTAFCIVLVALAARIIRGKGKLRGASPNSSGGISRNRLGLYAMLKKALQKLCFAVRFRLLCVSKRNTAPGLLMEIEKRSRSQLHGRGESETCREFLTRAVSVYPHAENELMQLAEAMDALHFGGFELMDSLQILALRKTIFNKNNSESQ